MLPMHTILLTGADEFADAANTSVRAWDGKNGSASDTPALRRKIRRCMIASGYGKSGGVSGCIVPNEVIPSDGHYQDHSRIVCDRGHSWAPGLLQETR